MSPPAAMSARVFGIAFDPTKVDAAERSGLDNSAAYLKTWLSALPEEDRRPELVLAISAAQKISDYVLELALAQELKLKTATPAPSGPRLRL